MSLTHAESVDGPGPPNEDDRNSTDRGEVSPQASRTMTSSPSQGTFTDDGDLRALVISEQNKRRGEGTDEDVSHVAVPGMIDGTIAMSNKRDRSPMVPQIVTNDEEEDDAQGRSRRDSDSHASPSRSREEVATSHSQLPGRSTSTMSRSSLDVPVTFQKVTTRTVSTDTSFSYDHVFTPNSGETMGTWLMDQIGSFDFVIIIVFKGAWNTYCRHYLRLWNSLYSDIRSFDGELFGVSSQGGRVMSELAQELDLDYWLISDEKLWWAERFRCDVLWNDTPAAEALSDQFGSEYEHKHGVLYPSVLVFQKSPRKLPFCWWSSPHESYLLDADVGRPMPSFVWHCVQSRLGLTSVTLPEYVPTTGVQSVDRSNLNSECFNWAILTCCFTTDSFYWKSNPLVEQDLEQYEPFKKTKFMIQMYRNQHKTSVVSKDQQNACRVFQAAVDGLEVKARANKSTRRRLNSNTSELRRQEVSNRSRRSTSNGSSTSRSAGNSPALSPLPTRYRLSTQSSLDSLASHASPAPAQAARGKWVVPPRPTRKAPSRYAVSAKANSEATSKPQTGGDDKANGHESTEGRSNSSSPSQAAHNEVHGRSEQDVFSTLSPNKLKRARSDVV